MFAGWAFPMSERRFEFGLYESAPVPEEPLLLISKAPLPLSWYLSPWSLSSCSGSFHGVPTPLAGPSLSGLLLPLSA